MSYSNDQGYVPVTIDAIMDDLRQKINTQWGTPYTAETFEGTGFYKYFYALAQKLQENEVKTSEIFIKLQTYFEIINARISRPVNTNPGIIEALQNYESELIPTGLVASMKPMIDEDAGKIHICVDVEDGDHAAGLVTITSYANLVDSGDDTVTVGATVFTAQAGAATPGDATFQAATSEAATATSLAAQINAHATAGSLVRATAIGAVVVITALHGGTDGNSIALAYSDEGTATVGATVSGSNLDGGTDDEDYADKRLEICTLISQSTVGGAVTQGTEIESITLPNTQSFDFKYNLPNRIPIGLRLTITLSENNEVLVGDPDQTKLNLIANIAARYKLGKNFEPQKYFSLADAPWASQVLLEYTTDIVDGAVAGGATWSSEVYDADYDELFTPNLDLVTLVEE